MENIQSEKVKHCKIEQRVVFLEQELARKERTWKVTESNFEKTISGLQENTWNEMSQNTQQQGQTQG